jgi:hypothetical protein
MRHFTALVGADNQPIPFHFSEVLGQHFLRCLRKKSAQFAGPYWAFLESAEDADFPFSLKQRQRKSNGVLLLRRNPVRFLRSFFRGL